MKSFDSAITSSYPRSPIVGLALAGALAGSGCALDAIGDHLGGFTDRGTEEVGDFGETGETGEPEPEPGEPTVSPTPLIAGATWSLQWGVDEWITDMEVGPAGLVIANDRVCALIDPSDGALRFELPELPDAERSAVAAIGDTVVWARRRSVVDGSRWRLTELDQAGVELGTVEVPGDGSIAFDAGKRIYAAAGDSVIAYTPDGTSSWTVAPTPGFTIIDFEGLDAGVELFEVETELAYPMRLRLRRLDANGTPLASVDAETQFALTDELTPAGGRSYLGAGGGFGPTMLFAVDYAGGLAWAAELEGHPRLVLEAGPAGGVHALQMPKDDTAELALYAADGTVESLGTVSTAPIHGGLLEFGPSGELYIAGHVDQVFELHRID